MSEGLVEMVYQMLRESLEATITRKIGYVLARTAFKEFKKRVDYSEYGGAPLLGVKGRLHHHPRPLQRQRDQERHSRGRRVRRR